MVIPTEGISFIMAKQDVGPHDHTSKGALFLSEDRASPCT